MYGHVGKSESKGLSLKQSGTNTSIHSLSCETKLKLVEGCWLHNLTSLLHRLSVGLSCNQLPPQMLKQSQMLKQMVLSFLFNMVEISYVWEANHKGSLGVITTNKLSFLLLHIWNQQLIIMPTSKPSEDAQLAREQMCHMKNVACRKILDGALKV